MKFSTKIDEDLLAELRAHAQRRGSTLTTVINEAAAQYLERAATQPVFREAADQVVNQHTELLERLAR